MMDIARVNGCASARVELSGEAHIAAEADEMNGQLRTMHEHSERPADRTTARDQGIHDRMVFGGHLILAGNGS